MEVKVNVPDRLAAEAQARGLSLEMYVEEMLAQQTIAAEEGTIQGSISKAIDRIRELRKQKTLFRWESAESESSRNNRNSSGRNSGVCRSTPNQLSFSRPLGAKRFSRSAKSMASPCTTRHAACDARWRFA